MGDDQNTTADPAANPSNEGSEGTVASTPSGEGATPLSDAPSGESQPSSDSTPSNEGEGEENSEEKSE